MSLPIILDGALTVVPGVYSSLIVQNSTASVAPAGRSAFILGEAEEGVPGSLLDLKANYFTDAASVKDFYRSGPIVDAARMLFSNQPSQVFTGRVQRLYVYKTNASTRASKTIATPANYGALLAARYGERGNQIKTQILSGQAESKPAKTFLYLPSPLARSFKVAVNGVVSAALPLLAGAKADALVTSLGTVSGLAASGGTVRTVNAAALVVDITATGDSLVLTKASGVGTFGTVAQLGDVAYIADGVDIAGTSDENAGSYIVVAWADTSVTLRRLKSHVGAGEDNASAFYVAAGVALGIGELLVNAPVSVSVSATTAIGSAATLELLESTGDKSAYGLIARDADFAALIPLSTASIARISATVPSAGKLTISLNSGSWLAVPQVGDLIRVGMSSLLAGATKKNVGMLVVESASARTLTVAHLFSGMTTEAVSSVLLAGATSTVEKAASFVSSQIASRRIDSSAESKVYISATQMADGSAMPTTLIGGNVALELGYYDVAATAANVTIDEQRVLTLDVTGTGLSDISLNLNKYDSLQALVDFLSTQAGVYARIPDSRYKSLPTSCLDMVQAVSCLKPMAVPAYVAKIKRDYYDWKKFFEDNFSILAFQEGSMVYKRGLPSAEAAATYLSGAVVGATDNASIQSGLDEALKISVRHVAPLFSRDAIKDIEDGLTDNGSSYSIDAINAALKAHVATASATLFKKRRIGMASFDGSFADSLQKVGELAYERCQFFFMRHDATDGDGNLVKFLPWMSACAVIAGRSQAILGTSMLRKPFLLSSAVHPGESSLYTDSLVMDFDPDNRGQLEDAIAAGLVVFRPVVGFGIRMESPDLSSRSRTNDPQAWVWERVNVLFTLDEVQDTLESTLENFIGNRTSDVPEALVRQALDDVLKTFLPASGNGALLAAKVLEVKRVGNQYKCRVQVTPAECLESITLTVEAIRSV